MLRGCFDVKENDMRRVSFWRNATQLSKSAHVLATSFQRIHLGRLGHSLFPSQLKRGSAVCSAYLYSIPQLNLLLLPSATMSRNALNLFRSATSSLSHRAVTRSYYPIHRRAAIHSRTYSGTTPENVNGTSDGPENAEKKAADTQAPDSPLSELEAKLKTKEDEVLDLTVRPSQQSIDATAPF